MDKTQQRVPGPWRCRTAAGKPPTNNHNGSADARRMGFSL